MPKSWPESWPT